MSIAPTFSSSRVIFEQYLNRSTTHSIVAGIAKRWMEYVVCANSAHEYRSTELRLLCGIDDVDSLVANLASFVKELTYPEFDNEHSSLTDTHLKQLVLLALHSLAHKTSARTGRNLVHISEMVFTLYEIIQRRLPNLVEQASQSENVMEQASTLMQPLAKELIDALFPRSQTWVPEFLTNGLIANSEMLQLLLTIDKIFKHRANRDALLAAGVTEDIERIHEKFGDVLRKAFHENSEQKCDRLVARFGAISDSLRVWLKDEAMLFLTGDSEQVEGEMGRVLLSSTAHLVTEIALNILLKSGSDPKEIVHNVANGVAKVIEFGIINQERIWISQTHEAEIFKPLAEILIKDFHLGDHGVLPQQIDARELMDVLPDIIQMIYRPIVGGLDQSVNGFSQKVGRLYVTTFLNLLEVVEGKR